MCKDNDKDVQGQSSLAWRRLSVAAIVAMVAHLLAGLSMVTILRHGLDTAELAYRLSFLAEQRNIWIIGWLAWQIAALSILYFYYCLAAAHKDADSPRSWILNFAVLVAVGGFACDLSAEAIEMGVLPDLAQKILRQLPGAAATEIFLTMHRAAVMMTGYLANGLYTLAAALLLFMTRHQYMLLVKVMGWLVVVSGTCLSVFCLTSSVSGMVWSNVVLLPALLLWQLGVAIQSAKRARVTTQ